MWSITPDNWELGILRKLWREEVTMERWERLQELSDEIREKFQVLEQQEHKNIQTELEDTTGWDTTLIKMWNKGHSRDEIAEEVHVSKDRVTNRVTELRNKFGADIVPYDKDRKKRLIKP